MNVLCPTGVSRDQRADEREGDSDEDNDNVKSAVSGHRRLP